MRLLKCCRFFSNYYFNIWCVSQILTCPLCPSQILTNQGRNCISKLFQLFCDKLGLAKLRTTPWNPQGNGKAEVFMRFVVFNLASIASMGLPDQSNWDLLLTMIAKDT